MSTIASEVRKHRVAPSAAGFGFACLTVASVAGVLAGLAPLVFSIAIVFLFAGPHNWMEARYFFGRMPARWGKLRLFFATGLCGAVGLAAALVIMTVVGRVGQWTRDQWSLGIAMWNTALILWVTTLTQLRGRTRPYRNWSWFIPCACLLTAATWIAPRSWSLALVYLHPLVALWYLDREIIRLRPEWRATYHTCLLVCGGIGCTIWSLLSTAPHLPGDDLLTQQITHHAGASLVDSISSHCLVAMHTYLEMLHYGVWLVALPWLSAGEPVWKVDRVPLAKRSHAWRLMLYVILGVGLLAVVGFWCGFLINYPLTRDIYFTVAIFHVLAEVPFLLRSL